VFQRALLPVDGSAFSEAAIPYLSKLDVGAVLVVQVIAPIAAILGRDGLAFDVPSDVAERLATQERSAIEDQLAGIEQRLRELGHASVDSAILEGAPGPAIIDAAREHSCDVVVMSTHGRTGMQRALLGSVANFVVHSLEDSAVLLVRPGSDVPS
jgi:nucleotide-binding universal stress UspA family protein